MRAGCSPPLVWRLGRFCPKHTAGLYQSSDALVVTVSIIFFLFFSSPASPLRLSLPLSFPEMLPCRWAIRSDHYFEAQTGCLDTGFGDELSRRAGSSSSSSSSQDRAVGPVSLSSSPQRLGLLCCFLRCSGWLKCLADRPLLKTYPSMASDLWRMRSYTLIQRAAWRGASQYEFCQLQQEGRERKRQGEKGEKKGKKDPLSPPSLPPPATSSRILKS